MEIKSLAFMLFCFVVAVAYFALQRTDKQKYVLLAADFYFVLHYSGLKAVIALFLICVAVFWTARQMEKAEKKKGWLWLGLVFTIGVLLFFKFFTGMAETLLSMASGRPVDMIKIIVPAGISYYTLAMCAYLVDIYHKKYKAETDLVAFLVYVTYFPAIVEGPINMYRKLMPQIKEKHTFDWDRMIRGLMRTLWGYLKKVVIADRIGILVMGILQTEDAHGIVILYALVIYSFQIYTDFSGGIDVIMGISQVLGIELAENFKSPLISKNVTEYWQRWHKSLGEFMEKYIYYPIVLNRKLMKFSKKIKNKYQSRAFSAFVASLIVFVIVGIWHGTGWNYVVYGMYQAFFVSTAVILKPTYTAVKKKLHVNEKCLSWEIFCILRTFVILVFGRLIIKASNLHQAGELLKKIVHMDNIYSLFNGDLLNYGLDYKNMIVMYIGILIVLLVDILHEQKVEFRELILKQDIVFRYAVYFTALAILIIFGVYGGEFSAASFIYQGY